MLKNDYSDQDCSIARALEVVGERWTLLIVREPLKRPYRFLDLVASLGVAKSILTNRLKKMIALGIVQKTSLSQYRLTAKDRDLFPVTNALMAWGDKYAAPNGPPAILLHTCGGRAGHKLVCQCCGEELRSRDLRISHQESLLSGGVSKKPAIGPKRKKRR
jgi:DNA-binding HxlR family transcriptional regulator